MTVLDGARTLGAKILISGGGRCNVTHHQVDETAFAGSTPAAIRKVLRRFDVARDGRVLPPSTACELKREETGKLFPVTDRARTVLDALLARRAHRGVVGASPVAGGRRSRASGAGFTLTADDGRTIDAARVVLATGGRSMPEVGLRRRRLRAGGVASATR